ncbi:MAG: hypothetical protein ABI378_03270 [Chitinophagaceae bacterium]
MRPIIFGFCLLLLVPFSGNALIKKGLKQALGEGFVNLEAMANGNSFMGRPLKIRIKNRTSEALRIAVEPALIFRPSDTNFQDLITSGNEVFAIAANATTELELGTFCGKAYASAPDNGLDFRYVGQADTTMQKLLRYIERQKLHDFLGQQAVWVLTDFHGLEMVYDPARPNESRALNEFVQKLVGGTKPSYFKIYAIDTTAGQPAFVNRILKIATQMEWKQPRAATLDLSIFNDDGKVIQTVFAKQEMKKGSYKINVEFEGEHAPKGKYYLRLKEGDNVLEEQEFTLD